MFYYLDGMVTIIEPNLAVVDCGGVGYACKATARTLSFLEVGKKARLYTYCHIKEDIFDIYAFHDMGEKRCFEMLLSVSGVGPKAALAILSACSAEEIAMAVINNDDKTLTRAQGVGKKLAQRIVLELKDKMSKEAGDMKMSGGFVPQAGVTGSVVSDASAALAVLGFTQGEISAAMRHIDTDNMTTEEIIKAVLKNTMK